MTIESDITGLAPVLYWVLDDPTGPAAVDTSGNSHTGVYGGTFMLAQSGPEPGSHAVQFANGGSVTCTGMPQPGTAPWTVVWYATRDTQSTPAVGSEIGHGNPSASRGWYWRQTNIDQSNLQWWTPSTPNTSGTAYATPVWNRWWHAYAVTWNGTSVLTAYIDGAVSQTPSLIGSLITLLSTDTFGVTAIYPSIWAHVAYFDKTLTLAQIGAIASHRYSWPYGPMIDKIPAPGPPAGGGALSPTDPVVVDINADLSDVLRAVRRNYP